MSKNTTYINLTTKNTIPLSATKTGTFDTVGLAVIGDGTKFLSECEIGDYLVIFSKNEVRLITDIESDTEMSIASPFSTAASDEDVIIAKSVFTKVDYYVSGNSNTTIDGQTVISKSKDSFEAFNATLAPVIADGATSAIQFTCTFGGTATNEISDLGDSGAINSITYDGLSAFLADGTAGNGDYMLTNRPNSGADPLRVTVFNNAVSSGAVVQRTKPAQGFITVGDNSGKEGVFNVKINNVVVNSTPIDFDGDGASSQEIADAIAGAIDHADYTAFNIGGENAQCFIRSSSGFAVNDYLISIESVSGDALVTDAINQFSNSPYYLVDHTCVYDFANDYIWLETDTQNNSAAPGFIIDEKAQTISNNNFNGGSVSANTFVGILTNNSGIDGGRFVLNDSNATIRNCTVTGGAINFYLLKELQELTNLVFIGKSGESFIPSEAINNIYINTFSGISNYEKEFSIAANTINFDVDNYHHWAGIVTITNTANNFSFTLDTINGLSYATKYFKIFPDAGVTLSIKRSTATNIKIPTPDNNNIDLDGDNGDFVECYHDGTNVYITNILTF